MELINLGENLVTLRRKKKLTQEEVANFVGVTKASVSKWENKQSLPDIMILPTLATLFDVTVDELLGYTIALNKDQIRNIYSGLADDFAKKPFDEVFEAVKATVKQYYSCFPMLKYICILLLNHYNLSDDVNKHMEVLAYIKKIISHVINDCKDSIIVDDVLIVEAMVNLLAQQFDEVIDSLEQRVNPYRLANGGTTDILIQAYLAKQDIDNAEKYSMQQLFTSILRTLSTSLMLLTIKSEDMDFCDATVEKLEALIDIYKLEEVNKNAVAQFCYQAALLKVMQGNGAAAIGYLEKLVKIVIEMMKNPKEILVNGDYFTRIDEWVGEGDLGVLTPRNEKVFSIDILKFLDDPVFGPIANEKRFIQLKKEFEKEYLNL